MAGHGVWTMAGVVLLAGCAAGQRMADRLVAPVPYRVEVSVTSDFRDPYRVLAGPSESYGTYPFVARTRSALERFARTRSAAGAREALQVAVHLVRLETTYRQLGAGLDRPPLQVASLAGGVGLGWADGGANFSIPDEIRKRARLVGAVVFEGPEGRVGPVAVVAEAEEVVLPEDYDGWAYHYGGVLEGVRRAWVEKLDRNMGDLLPGR